MMIRTPNCLYFPLLDPTQRSGVDIGQLGAAKAIKHVQGPGMIVKRDGENAEPRQYGNEGAQASRGFLAVAMEEPRMGFRYYQQRGDPPSTRTSEEFDGLGVQTVAPAERGNEDAGIEKYGSAHGASRP